jgi:hypothetical protein
LTDKRKGPLSVPANKLPIIKNLDVSLLIRLFGIRHVY